MEVTRWTARHLLKILKKLDIKFDCEDIDTINGYLIYKLSKIPDENEEFETGVGDIYSAYYLLAIKDDSEGACE